MRPYARGSAPIRPIAVIFPSLAFFLTLVLWDGQLTFSPAAQQPAFMLELVEYGFSTCAAFTFIAVGLVVWLYVRDRPVAWVLLVFCLCGALVFSLETAATQAPSVVLDVLTNTGSDVGFYAMAVLLLLFPRNYLANRPPWKGGEGGGRSCLPYAYLGLLTVLLLYDSLSNPSFAELARLIHTGQATLATTSNRDDYAVSLVFLLSPVVTLALTYHRSTSPRERLQGRILGVGLLLAYLPFIVGTLLPLSLALGNHDAVLNASVLTTVFFPLIPVSLGYAILRYHVLLVDRHIRTVVTLLVGGVLLAVGAYLVFFCASVLFAQEGPLALLGAACACLLLVVAVGGAAPWVSKRIFAPDLAAAHLHLYGEDQPPQPRWGEDDPVASVARLLMEAARSVLGPQQVCFLAFHRESAAYRPVFLQKDEVAGQKDSSSPLLTLLKPALHGEGTELGWLDAREPLFAHLAAVDRPLPLSAARSPSGGRGRTSIPHLLAARPTPEDPLLVPLKTGRGTHIGSDLVGVLVLGARDTTHPYAGPDFTLIDVLLVRYAWMLEAAMQEEQTRQHVAMLNTLSTPPAAHLAGGERTLDELAAAYADVVSSALRGSAEVWLYSEPESLLRRGGRAGTGPFLCQAGDMMPVEESDWTCWFSDGEEEPWKEREQPTRPGLLEPPTFPFAWLPLNGERPVGVLVLTYPQPRHAFLPAERQILELFADQLALALESARIAMQLRTDADTLRLRRRAKGQELLSHVQHFLQPVIDAHRYLVALLAQDGRPAAQLLAPAHVEVAPLAAETCTPDLAGALTRLVAATRSSLALLHTLASTAERDIDPAALAAHVRRQVNSILRDLEEARQPEVLVITDDGDFGTMLVSALGLEGYRPSLVGSCQEGVQWMRQRMLAEAEPAALIVDSSLLGGSADLHTFTRSLHPTWPAWRLPPLLLVTAGEPWTAHLPQQYTTLEAPFAVSALLQLLHDGLRRSPGAGS